METVLDVETTFKDVDGKNVPSPYNPDNRLVSVGYKTSTGEEDYLCFYHKEKAPTPNARAKLQDVLKRTRLIIGHNLKFDLSWLYEIGFEYEGEAWDTMLCEYVLARGLKPGMGLDDALTRYNLPNKDAVVQGYLEQGIGFEAMPWEVVEKYGRQDVNVTRLLYDMQLTVLSDSKNSGLLPTIRMSNEFMLCLVDIERNGIAIDLAALDKLEIEYEAERTTLFARLNEIAQSVMGDTPINLNSPEQLSQLIFSRKIKDKKEWVRIFNVGSELRGSVRKKRKPVKLSAKEFVNHVKAQTEFIYRTKAESCVLCKGTGGVRKLLKNGSFGRNTKCPACSGHGLTYRSTDVIAGLRQAPDGPDWVSALGFSTDKETLDTLASRSKGIAQEFLLGMIRYNAICTYLDSFVGGIRRGLRSTKGEVASELSQGTSTRHGGEVCSAEILHPEFMQAVTATGRLSSRNPNFQNQPRGNTFPIRKVVVSRWKDRGGKVLEPDFSQLEFRVAVFQAQDEQGKKDIADNVDIHSITSRTLTEAGQPTDRQDAKPHTFKPLYGGTTGTQAEQTYYRSFLDRYKGIAKWQSDLQSEAIRGKIITLPTGRQYAFPNARRTQFGGATGATQIKNYPVQGFATADIVPCAVIDLWRAFKARKLKSRIINTVHDSIAIDVHPEELDVVPALCRTVLRGITVTLKNRYNIDMNVPLDTEMKMGDNWLELNKIKEERKAA